MNIWWQLAVMLLEAGDVLYPAQGLSNNGRGIQLIELSSIDTQAQEPT